MSSHKRVAVTDRGAAHYFHGREQEINFFNKILALSKKNQKSHSILIQGAPGVGKSALLNEFGKQMKKRGCHVVKLELNALLNVNRLQNALIGEKNYDKTSKEVQINFRVLRKKMRYDRTEPSISKMVKAVDKPIILSLDEAQMIRVGIAKDSLETKKIANLFDEIHNLELKHGLVFLIAGLSHTRKIFKDFEISRFNDDYVINLSILDKEAENNILKDYLVEGARVAVTDSNLNHWVNQMSKETHQWAHHVSCYGQVALEKIKEEGGQLSEDLLSEVLKESRRKKKTYYHERFAELEAQERASIYHALFENEQHENIVIGTQVKSDFKNNPTVGDPKQMFQDLVSWGVLQMRPDGFYQIPIPSLRTWMLQEYQNYLKMIGHKPSVRIQRMFDLL